MLVIITQKVVENSKKHQPGEPYVTEITQQVIKDAQNTTTCQKEIAGAKVLGHKQTWLTTIIYNNHRQIQGNASQQDSAHFLVKFLEEFKSLFNQFMQQNSMVLNMLTILMNNVK